MNKEQLEEIIDTYKWIKVKGFKESDYDNWKDGFDALNDHHIKETTFLIEKCRELAKELLSK